MLVNAAEETFQKGMDALADGRRREAMARFEAAIEIEHKFGVDRPQARYLSYYGLCLGLEREEFGEALRFCREAVMIESYNADLRHNLGRVLMRAGLRREAHNNLVRGLRLHAGHKGIRRVLRTMGKRRRPPLPFLSRSHPVNVFLGRIRAFTPGQRPRPRVLAAAR